MNPESLIVDLGNPEDVRSKLPQARAVRDEKRHEWETWEARVRVLEEFAAPEAAIAEPQPDDGEPEPEGKQQASSDTATSPASALDLAIEVVNRQMRPIRAKDVHLTLVAEGHDVSQASVGNSLYYAALTAEKIQKLVGRGRYAPLEYRDDQTILDSANGAGSSTLEVDGRTAPTA